jgi:hypothetical protein
MMVGLALTLHQCFNLNRNIFFLLLSVDPKSGAEKRDDGLVWRSQTVVIIK